MNNKIISDELLKKIQGGDDSTIEGIIYSVKYIDPNVISGNLQVSIVRPVNDKDSKCKSYTFFNTTDIMLRAGDGVTFNPTDNCTARNVTLEPLPIPTEDIIDPTGNIIES